jgi:hypothetical protein
MQKILMSLVCGAMLAAGTGVCAQETSAFETKYNAVLSKLQSMGHGYYSEKEWAAIDQSVRIWCPMRPSGTTATPIVKAP